MTVAIRIAGPADAPALARLASDTFTETFGTLYPPEDLQAFLAESYAVPALVEELCDPDQRWWIAEEDGRAVGYAQAGPCALPHADAVPANGELKRLYVLATHQKTGLGRDLFEQVLTWIGEAFEGPIWIGVWSGNHKALRFYGGWGFEPCGGYEFPVGQTRDQEFILRRG